LLGFERNFAIHDLWQIVTSGAVGRSYSFAGFDPRRIIEATPDDSQVIDCVCTSGYVVSFCFVGFAEPLGPETCPGRIAANPV
jgi:hypothetical protein